MKTYWWLLLAFTANTIIVGVAVSYQHWGSAIFSVLWAAYWLMLMARCPLAGFQQAKREQGKEG